MFTAKDDLSMVRKTIYRRLAWALLLCLLTGCGSGKDSTASSSPESALAPEEPAFTVDLLSTGKSDCAVIRMDGLVIVSDTADEDDYKDIDALLKHYGITRIDYMILSHYDKDHIGSAAALLRNYEVGAVLRPDYVEESGEYFALVKAEKDTAVDVVILKENYVIRTSNGSIVADPPDQDYGDDNNNSIVTTITYMGRRLLFLGDARKKRVEEFLKAAEESYDFVKLPHHGDGNKALYSLLRKTSPVWAAATISAAETIDPELQELLDKLNITLYCTVNGPVRIVWDAGALAAEQYA